MIAFSAQALFPPKRLGYIMCPSQNMVGLFSMDSPHPETRGPPELLHYHKLKYGPRGSYHEQQRYSYYSRICKSFKGSFLGTRNSLFHIIGCFPSEHWCEDCMKWGITEYRTPFQDSRSISRHEKDMVYTSFIYVLFGHLSRMQKGSWMNHIKLECFQTTVACRGQGQANLKWPTLA